VTDICRMSRVGIFFIFRSSGQQKLHGSLRQVVERQRYPMCWKIHPVDLRFGSWWLAVPFASARVFCQQVRLGLSTVGIWMCRAVASASCSLSSQVWYRVLPSSFVRCCSLWQAFYLTDRHTRLTALLPGLPRWAGTRKVKPIWILLKQETVSGSSISWAVCKSGPQSRQITMPANHHSVFYRPDALPADQPTVSKHWRLSIWMLNYLLYSLAVVLLFFFAWTDFCAVFKMLLFHSFMLQVVICTSVFLVIPTI